ncbi:MAG: hypothetical protein HQK96_03765 [Nitrospirae bacterium]|nr:hypothetical protein [Nitrospirota bacterium]
MKTHVVFEDLIGKILVAIENKNTELVFTTSEGDSFMLHHDQDCCERVCINDIEGDLNNLIGQPILQAQESTNSKEPRPSEYSKSFTWTFYKLATIKGYVTIRWLGESNGYYSESVSFKKV